MNRKQFQEMKEQFAGLEAHARKPAVMFMFGMIPVIQQAAQKLQRLEREQLEIVSATMLVTGLSFDDARQAMEDYCDRLDLDWQEFRDLLSAGRLRLIRSAEDTAHADNPPYGRSPAYDLLPLWLTQRDSL